MKMHLALNNLQWLICHKTKPNQTIVFGFNFHSVYISGFVTKLPAGLAQS